MANPAPFQVVDVPSYLVRVDSEKHIDFAVNSPFAPRLAPVPSFPHFDVFCFVLVVCVACVGECFACVPSSPLRDPSVSGKPGRKARATLKKKSGGDDE